MFVSKKRQIVIPQSEHARFAGQLAAGWGNGSFDKPPLEFVAFVEGVALHDWHFGLMDNHPIGNIADEDWIEITRKAVDMEIQNPVSDIVAKLHVRRLLTWDLSDAADQMIDDLDRQIDSRLNETNQLLKTFQLADTITCLLDFISFDFCFEQPKSRTSQVCADFNSEHMIETTVELREHGTIVVDPWPFAFEKQSGILMGYHLHQYPENPQPVAVPYEITSI